MHFGFSYTGLLLLLMLFVPNLYWTKNKPADYDQYAPHENKVLLCMERAGEVLVTGLLLVFRDFNIQGFEPRLLWLASAFALMVLYVSQRKNDAGFIQQFAWDSGRRRYAAGAGSPAGRGLRQESFPVCSGHHTGDRPHRHPSSACKRGISPERLTPGRKEERSQDRLQGGFLYP